METVPDHAPEHHGKPLDPIAKAMAATAEALQWSLEMGRQHGWEDVNPQDLKMLLRWTREFRTSTTASREVRALCKQLLREIEGKPETPDYPEDLTSSEPLSPDRQDIWRRHSRPKRKRPDDPARQGTTPPASYSPLVSYLVCLRCEAFFYGQPLGDLPLSPVCQQAQLRHMGTWDLATDAFYPCTRWEV